MATVTSLASSAGATGLHVRAMDNNTLPRKVFTTIDFAAAATAKGSALAAADVIEALTIPVGSVVLAAGLKVKTAVTTTATDLAVTLGTADDADQWVAAFDLDAASAGAYAPAPVTAAHKVFTAQDTIDITISAMTGNLTAGEVEVWAIIVDLTSQARGQIAALKS